MTIILFLLLLSIIVTIHEFGHFLVAKLFGVYCFEFSIGMGPALFTRKGKETKFSIRALPIGGYVSMAGEVDGDEAYPEVKVPEGRRLTDQKAWKKICIMLAGVTMNFLLAWIIFSMYLLNVGTFNKPSKPVIASIMENSPAQDAGLMAGDTIIKVTKEDGSSIQPSTFMEFQAFNADNTGKEIIVVLRNNQQVTVEVTPVYNEEAQSYIIGISASAGEPVKVNLLNCWYYGFYQMGVVINMTLQALLNLVRGRGLNQLSGPVGIYQATETYASLGFGAYMMLIAQISLNVGIFNLLPLPVLDGGQVVITILETITHRQFNEKIKTAIMIVCWLLLISVMIFATWNDISKLLMR